jgi:hypothetical protein
MNMSERRHLFGFALLLSVFGALSIPVHAQPQFTPAMLATLQPLDPTNVPLNGTFWLLEGPFGITPCPPLPCPPGDPPGSLGIPIYDLGGGHFLVDDTAVDWAALWQQQELNRALNGLETRDGGTLGPLDRDSFTPDDLWLELLTVTNATGFFVLHPRRPKPAPVSGTCS